MGLGRCMRLPNLLPGALGDTVDETAEIEAQQRHVEASFASEHADDVSRQRLAQDSLHKVIAELVVSGSDRRVGGENALLPDRLEIPFARAGKTSLPEELHDPKGG